MPQTTALIRRKCLPRPAIHSGVRSPRDEVASSLLGRPRLGRLGWWKDLKPSTVLRNWRSRSRGAQRCKSRITRTRISNRKVTYDRPPVRISQGRPPLNSCKVCHNDDDGSTYSISSSAPHFLSRASHDKCKCPPPTSPKIRRQYHARNSKRGKPAPDHRPPLFLGHLVITAQLHLSILRTGKYSTGRM